MGNVALHLCREDQKQQVLVKSAGTLITVGDYASWGLHHTPRHPGPCGQAWVGLWCRRLDSSWNTSSTGVWQCSVQIFLSRLWISAVRFLILRSCGRENVCSLGNLGCAAEALDKWKQLQQQAPATNQQAALLHVPRAGKTLCTNLQLIQLPSP